MASQKRGLEEPAAVENVVRGRHVSVICVVRRHHQTCMCAPGDLILPSAVSNRHAVHVDES